MRYTDRFFEFPIRVYDRFTAEKAEKEEKINDVPLEGDWAAGKARIPYDQISAWTDYFDSTQGVNGVRENGFKFTMVLTYADGAFICIWEKTKFEERLNAYAEKYERWREDEASRLIEKLRELNPE